MKPVDVERFWNDNDVALRDPFAADIPQAAMGMGMGYHNMFAELGLAEDNRRLQEDYDWARQCAKAYNDKAEHIVGRRLLNETAHDPTKRFPRIREIGELFGCKRVWQSESWWLLEAANTPDELARLLDNVDALDIKSAMMPDDWEEGCKHIYEQHGLRPSPGLGLRGPVTLAMSIYGTENLIYLIMDQPELAERFRDTLLRVILEYFQARVALTEPSMRRPGFGFFDDQCAMLTPDMYAFFGQPILQTVYDTFAPGSNDRRYQHSDSDMAHLLPLLTQTGMNRVNFGPNVRFKEIREAMPNAVVEGTLAPFTFMRNDEESIIAEVNRDLEEANQTRGLVVATAGSVNDGTRLTSLRAVMHAIQHYGKSNGRVSATPRATDNGRTWTSRERLFTALDCAIPDRVPISTYELVGFNSKAWENMEPSYQKLMDRIRSDTDCIAMWNAAGNSTFWQSAAPIEMDRKVLRDESQTRTAATLRTPKGDLHCTTEREDHVHTSWVIEHWCKNKEDVDRAMSIPFEPITYDASDCARIYEEVGERGLVMTSLGDPAYVAAALMSFEDFTLWAFEDTEHFAGVVDEAAKRVIANLERMLDACVVDLYRICGPEYFTPPYLPPSMFERFVVPHVRDMTRLIQSRGARVRLHCHGRIGRVLDYFFETGCDATDPCEPPPDGDIELDEVKRRCADHGVSVFGNMELRQLEGDTPEQIRETVRRQMDQAKAGGGFVLMPTAAPINVPLSPKTEANYMAMIDAAIEYGTY